LSTDCGCREPRADFSVELRGFEPTAIAVQRARHLQRRVRVLPRLLHRSLAARWPAAADPPVPGSDRAFLTANPSPHPRCAGDPSRAARPQPARPSTAAMPGALIGLAYRDAATPRLRPSLGRAPHATAGEESLLHHGAQKPGVLIAFATSSSGRVELTDLARRPAQVLERDVHEMMTFNVLGLKGTIDR
jgi:hypothetical protein